MSIDDWFVLGTIVFGIVALAVMIMMIRHAMQEDRRVAQEKKDLTHELYRKYPQDHKMLDELFEDFVPKRVQKIMRLFYEYK